MKDLQSHDIYSHDGPLFTDFGNTKKKYIFYTFIYAYKSRGGYTVKKSRREKAVLLSPSCECRLWLFLRTSSVQFFSPTRVWNATYCQADVKQTLIYLSISFLTPIPSSVYGSLMDCRSAAKRQTDVLRPQTTNTPSSPKGSVETGTTCQGPECINRPRLP